MTQCLLTSVTIFLILMSLNVIPNDVVVASIAATSFMVFAMPHRRITRVRYIVGGYVFGLVCGVVCHMLAHTEWIQSLVFLVLVKDNLFAAIAVGMAMFLMVLFNCEHSPAAAVSLGLVINEWSIRTIVLTVLALFLILSYRFIFRNIMIDLV